MDLRVLLAAGINQILFCPKDSDLLRAFVSWGRSGDRFSVMDVTRDELWGESLKERVKEELGRGNAAVLSIDFSAGEEKSAVEVERRLVALAISLGAGKLFFPGDAAGLTVDGVLKGYPTADQVRQAVAAGATLNIAAERLLFFIEQQELHGIDIVLAEARRGSIFEEVFTHGGSGTLLSQEYSNELRSAREGDVRDIMALLQPYVVEGSLKPVTEDEILSIISSFKVYSVNGQIVCAAALLDYGDSCELAKLCTLPRFQARGRAGALVRALLDQARVRGKRTVFALTVQPYVGEFFERLGFKAIDRKELPSEWQSGYDFSRASKGYSYKL
jgi:amino-acid N-acetyltransferase